VGEVGRLSFSHEAGGAKDDMRKSLLAIGALLGLVTLDLSAYAKSYAAHRGSSVYGTGCYWHRGRHYCNRYCYREVDGFWFSQPRLRDAGSQAPPPVQFYPRQPSNKSLGRHRPRDER
jgi:hypothetical protein